MSTMLPPSSDGDEDKPEESETTPLDELVIKRRMELIEHPDFSLSPASLVGSWFHRLENSVIVWDGCVVGEVAPKALLLQVRQGLEGLERNEAQIPYPLDAMFAKDDGYEFRFYDTREEMMDSFAEYTVRQERRLDAPAD